MYKQHDVVMLSTNKASNLMLTRSKLLCWPETQSDYNFVRSHGNVIDQHLYILSDDEIKEGDWFYHGNTGVSLCTKISGGMNIASNKGLHQITACKKIIATTDTSLMLHDNSKNNKCFGTQLSGKCPHVLPQIPISFIQYFIEQYNKGNVITKVNVEYVIWTQDIKTNKFSLFVSPFNCINIKTIKDSYSKDEYEAKLRAAFKAGFDYAYSKDDTFLDENKWIEQNL